MAILTGLGRPDFTTIGLTTQKLLAVEPMEFAITGTSTNLKSTKYRDGRKVIAGSAQESEAYTLKVGIEAANWAAIAFAVGEIPGITATIALPDLRYASVPLVTPFEIVDADITNPLTYVALMERGSWGEPKPLTTLVTGTPTTSQVVVSTVGTKMTFAAALAGASISYRVFKTYTSIDSIGVESIRETLSAFAFSGIAYTDDGSNVKIVIPKMVKTNAPSITLSGVTKLEAEFDLITTGSDPRPFRLFKLP